MKQALPVIALVGRPNVGKSTLFNVLTHSRDALVADYPGLTRDRQYGRCRHGTHDYIVIDTGGLCEESSGIEGTMGRQVRYAIAEADLILLMTDARHGLHANDPSIAQELRKTGKPILLVVNKSDGLPETAVHEFHALALGDPLAISSAHHRGINELLESIDAAFPESDTAAPPPENTDQRIAIAIVGRPNVGKSTLINRLLGEDRVIVFDEPGTTRDSIYIPFTRDGIDYTLIDTAGVRRRSKVSQAIEKYSVIKTLQAIDKAHIAISLVDAREGITEQDLNLMGMILDAGRGLIVGFNKWDGMTPEQKDHLFRQRDLKLDFLDFAEKFYISALHGSGVGNLFDAVAKVHAAASIDIATSKLTAILKSVVEEHQPPLVRGRRIRLKYAHQGGRNPCTIVIHGNQTESVPLAYKRFLMNTFRQKLRLVGVPIRLEFKSSDNPFKDQPNPLTERQQRKRKRLLRHIKK